MHLGENLVHAVVAANIMIVVTAGALAVVNAKAISGKAYHAITSAFKTHPILRTQGRD